ncbi:hypothetical protein NT6N_38400 [Oceaniferula spumae]|uniref:TNase-like domain-containing protein n=1 Tax=Oceaniferula spumae TaxID=2979115 RepID=A0AAT9FRZ6_9BACT
MARQKKKTVVSTLVTVVIVAAIIWMKYQETHDAKVREGSVRDESVVIKAPQKQEAKETSKLLSPVNLSSNRFEVLESCSLIDNRGNDGDSFHVKTSKGEEEVRLYFVDAPESAARRYGNGDTNYKRIAEQGASMGGLNQKQTTQVGVEAKVFTKKLLTARKFTIATTREKVYRSHRIYAYVIVKWEGQDRYLHELLVARGLGRIHTKPMTLPDNTSGSRQRDRLKKIENYAKSKNYGAWGIQ